MLRGQISSVAPAHGSAPPALRLFRVVLSAEAEGMDSAELGTWVGAARDRKHARSQAYDALWDVRLNAADAHPVWRTTLLYDNALAPYVVTLDAGEYDRFDSFAKAVKVAQSMREANGDADKLVEVVDAKGNMLLAL